jgi:hypothetical protein
MSGDDEVPHDLCFLPNVISATRDRLIMWHVWGEQLHTGFWWGSLKESDSLGDEGIGGRISN